MPELKQVLRDFVATSNSGKYATEEELLSKFPELKGYNIQTLKDFVATNNSGKYKTEDELFSKFPEFNLGGAVAPKKKDLSVSTKSQEPQAGTMESPSEDGSSVTVSQEVKDKQAILTKRALDKYKKDNEKPFSSPLAKLGIGTAAVLGEFNKSIYQFADDLIVNARKSLQEEGFFDDDIPDTNTPITDAVKKKVVPKENKDETTNLRDVTGLRTANKTYGGGGPLDPTPLIKLTAKIASKVINSSLPQDKKNAVIASLNQADSNIKKRIKDVEYLQEYALPEDNIAINVTKGIVGMAPDLLVAATMKTPSAAEGKFAKWSTEVSKDAKPLIAKYAPKAAKFVEEAVRAPFTKIMAAKGALSEMANTKEGEDMVDAGIEGGIKGAAEGVYMHTLGVVAGKAMPVIAKQISRTGMNSKFATAIANPLSNAGVFASAKALRTPIEEGRLATGEELATEVGMGVGFSLLHAGSLYKTHNEANHYYDNTLKTDPLDSFGRVVNETKENLDLAYNPDLTEAQVKELESARDELKAAIIKEPDLNNKKLLGNEAVKIQNQLDAHSAIKAIVENRETLVEQINSNENLNEKQKEFYTKKVEAIADHFDNSEFGLKKKDLDFKIKQAEKDLEVSSETFTNLTRASDRKLAKIKIEEQRKKLEDLNKELDDLVTNKYKEDAVQKQTTDESVLRTEKPELELQGMGEGNAKPEGLTQEETIINEKPEEVKGTPIKDAIGDLDGIYYYNGEKGKLVQFGDIVSFESDNKITDLIDINDVTDQTIEDFGVNHEKELDIKLNDDNSIELNGKKYVNNYSNPESAFGRDKEGNYTVTLETENGQKRTFRGQQADRIVYETRLKNFEKNGTEQQIEDAHAAADEAIRIEDEARAAAPERKGKSVRKGKQRTLKTVKEPLTKAEREAQVKPQEIEVKAETVPVETKTEVAPAKNTEQNIANEIYTKADNENSKLKRDVDNESPKLEYDGDNESIKEEIERYDRLTRKVEEDGSFSNRYAVGLINKLIRKGIDTNNTRKLTNALRKAGIFHTYSYEMRGGNNFSTLISDSSELIADTYSILNKSEKIEATKIFTKLAKELGVDVASLETEANRPVEKIGVEAKAETAPEVKTELTIDEQMAKYIDEANSYQDEMSAVEKDNSLTEEEKNDKLDELDKKYMQALKKSNALAFEKARTKPSEIKELLNLDTTEKTNLQKVSDYLDKLDKSLDLDPNELNDVTRVMAVSTAKAVIKTLKALVNAGITLQKAIQMASEAHKVKPEEIIDALDIVSKINENKSEGISEMELPGYNKLSKVIDSAIANGKTIDNILNYMNRSDVYKNATDVQKELLVRDVRKRFGLREKSAPSVGKLFGKIKDIAKITMTEKAALVKQIKDTAKGARQSIQEWRKQTQELTKDLAELKKSGKITTSQETAILNKFGKVNIFSEKSVARFTDYMAKVFADADYKEKLSNARKNLSSIKKLSKNEEKNGDLRALGSEFSKIDPSMVENIDEYNDISKKIKEAIDGSKIRKADTKFAETVNIEDTTAYIEKTLQEQEAKLREEKINELQDLLGIDAKDFKIEEIDALLESDEDIDLSKENEKIVRSKIEKAFDTHSAIIKEILETGEDPFTGEEISFSKKQKELIEKFMKIDPNKFEKVKDAIRAVDSLINFLENKSTAGMLRPIADFEAIVEGDKLVKEGIESKALRKFGFRGLGRLLGEQTTTLPVLFEKLFKGFNRASKVEDKMGVTDLVNSKSFGQNEGNAIVNDYVRELFKKKANGEEFNSAYNDIERGVLAHVMRNIIGTEAEMKKEFDIRKQEVKDGAELLISKGNEQEREIGEIVKKAYDKILDGSETIQDAKNKVDNVNLEGVEYWINQWEKKYDSLSDLSLNFYNKVLGKGINYTPDRVRKLQGETEKVDLENNESAFINNTDGVLYNKKTGSLMEKSKDRKVPKNMYIDFSFDKKNANAMYDALIDLNTAFHIRKVQSFLNSDNFRKIFKEDGDLVKKRIAGFIRNSRNKNPYSGSELTGMIKQLDKIATIGVTQALASPIQPFKQTIPVAVSTAINAGSLGMGAAFNPGYNAWLNNLGYAISNRGMESSAEIESINKLLEKAANSKKEEAIRLVKKANDIMLKSTLVKPDVWIARASFKAYYEQSLKRQGEKSSNIDYNDHKVNKEAANYAQRMVDRQQNISDHDLAGDLFTDKNSVTKASIKMLMAFSTFRMNQGSRLAADLTTLEYWNTSTKQDKIIALRSIAGYAAEQATFRALQIGYGMLLYYGTKKLMNRPEDEDEDKKFKNNLIKAASTSTVTDTFSPFPLLDPYVQNFSAATLDTIQDVANISEEEKIKLFEANKQEAIKMLGVYGIVPEKVSQIWNLTKLAYGKKYTDDFGKQKEISQEDADALKSLIGPFLASSITGVASPDISSVTRKAIKMAEKGAKTTEPKKGGYEDYKKSKEKQVVLDSIIDASYDQDIIDAAEQKKKELEYAGTDYQKAMNKKEERKKKELLFDPETGTQYDNEEDLKKYNESLWNENFGPNSDWEQEHQYEDEVDRMVTDALTKKEEEEYNYVKPEKKKKTNSDGTRKRSR